MNPLRASVRFWKRWEVVTWSMSAERVTATLSAWPLEVLACWRARLWLARRAHVEHVLPIVRRTDHA